MKKTGLLTTGNIKYLVLLFSVFLICIACNQKTHPTTSNEPIESIDPMEGVWKKTLYYRLANGDTTYKSENSVQHKIYLDGYVMWNSDPGQDGSEWHGFGTYTYKNDTLTETLTSMSRLMRGDNNTHSIMVDLGENSFEQILKSENNGIIYLQVEVYKKIN